MLVHRDPNFAGHASIKMASDDAPTPLLRYKPEFESELPHLSAFQCGMALRSIQAKTVNRFDLASSPAMAAEVKQLIEIHLCSTSTAIPMPMVHKLCQQLGLVVGLQLRNAITHLNSESMKPPMAIDSLFAIGYYVTQLDVGNGMLTLS